MHTKVGSSSQSAVISDISHVSSNTTPPSPIIVPPTQTTVLPLEKLLGSLRANLRILRRIPKGARGTLAAALSSTLDACVPNGDPAPWARLLQFAALCLRIPEDPTTHKTSLTTLVIRNANDFLKGKVLSPVISPPPRPSRTLPVSSSAVQAKLSEGDVRGAVRLLGSTDSFTTPTSQVLEDLQKHHPPPDPGVNPFPPVDDISHVPLRVVESEVRGAIASFPAGSAGGMDFLRPQHLKDLTSHSAGAAGVRLLSSLTRMCNIMLSGGVPDPICPVLYGASLCALKKKTGGIRPIAIGCTLRRLVSKIGSFHISSRLGSSLQPAQFGFGVKKGIEIATHLSRRFVTASHSQPEAFLKVDFSNAFNSVDRATILQEASSNIPELYRYIHQCYASPSYLSYGDSIIPSSRGVQQGDPLGPPLFSLAVHPLISSLSTDINIWYLDDGSLGGPVQSVLQAFSTLQTESPGLGLTINPEKCELYVFGLSPEDTIDAVQRFQNIAPGISTPPLESCSQLGAPMFPTETASSLLEKTSVLRLISSRMKDLPAHCSHYILKHSQSIPKLTHLLRCSPAWMCPNELLVFDSALRESLTSISNVPLSDAAWEQSSWPVSKGGLGIAHASDVALPAFLSSNFGTQVSVQSLLPATISSQPDDYFNSGCTAWTDRTLSPIPTPDLRSSQKEWMRTVYELSHQQAMEQATTPLVRARLQGVASAESGAFLDVLPSRQLGTLMDDTSFRIAVALRLGAEVCQPHHCSCGSQVTPLGLHGLNCRSSSGRLSRHSEVNAIIKRALASADIPSILEPSHLALDSNIRPDGVTCYPWSLGKSMAWDFTCTNSLAPSHVEKSATTPLYAATLAESAKHSKYAYLPQSCAFVPIAFECLGSAGREGLAFLRDLGKRITAATGERRATTYLLQRISVAIQHGNARSITGSLPTGANLGEFMSFLG